MVSLTWCCVCPVLFKLHLCGQILLPSGSAQQTTSLPNGRLRSPPATPNIEKYFCNCRINSHHHLSIGGWYSSPTPSLLPSDHFKSKSRVLDVSVIYVAAFSSGEPQTLILLHHFHALGRQQKALIQLVLLVGCCPVLPVLLEVRSQRNSNQWNFWKK